jgi:hypothetical protein
MANQKMGGCKKRRRKGVATGNPRQARAGRNMKPRCGRPMTDYYVRQMIAIERMLECDEKGVDRRVTHKERFKALPKNARKRIYGVTNYLY